MEILLEVSELVIIVHIQLVTMVLIFLLQNNINDISGVIVSEPWSDPTKDYKIGICCFSDKPTLLRRTTKYWLARNQGKYVSLGRHHVYQRTVVSVV